ncbi:MAG: hypothetical protein AB8G11_08515 [Saprospiraceae bacterium]
MKNVFFVFVCLFIMTACEPGVYFEDPQPIDGKTEKKFDRKYIGKYKSSSNNGAFLEITKSNIITEYFWKEEYTKDGIDTMPNFEWKGDELYHYDESQKYTRRGDTIIIDKYSKKIVFDVKDDILKSYKKMYFLNQEYDSGWNVKKLVLNSKKNLVLSKISSSDEIEHLEQVTTVETVMHSDTSESVDYYKVKPTDNEFDDIIDGSFFTVEDVYTRID